ncbi:MAG: hypothetical protein VR72_16380 [Clostridiaceae bacterium BRH_c20a]|nr:MAG: hypothetical protein VR72_16380 [Clostridiaceae bacterium BRH_c20a]
MINDTIAAIVTAMGAASVGIIRISGPDAIKIGNLVYDGKRDFIKTPSHSILYGKVYDQFNKKIIDEALFLIMKEPSTFSGEDIVEIQCHGGIIPVRKVLELVLRNGARIAEPGEFSKRAFLNGKLDLAQAESIMDIVNAKTEKGLEVAINQLQGGLSLLVNEVRYELLRLVAFIEADIDFPDDDIERLNSTQQLEKLIVQRDKLINILLTAQKGKILREGLNVIIIGKPNVGKSSLLNALLRENKAIVTDIPGTTRDAIEEYINLGGIPIKLVDTAGIRESENLVEQIGIEKAKEFITKADLILYVLDIIEGISDDDKKIILQLLNKVPTLFLANKVDLQYNQEKVKAIKNVLGEKELILISAKESQGLEAIEERIAALFFEGSLQVSGESIVTSTRHVQALQIAYDHLKGAINSIQNDLPGDFVVIDIRSSWEHLGKITGDTIEDDILDQIFSQFCLGK